MKLCSLNLKPIKWTGMLWSPFTWQILRNSVLHKNRKIFLGSYVLLCSKAVIQSPGLRLTVFVAEGLQISGTVSCNVLRCTLTDL